MAAPLAPFIQAVKLTTLPSIVRRGYSLGHNYRSRCSSLFSNVYHRLNGSSSPVLTATSFLWGIQKFDPHKIKTPDPIEIKFGTFDYVGEGTCHVKFYANSSKGASQQMGEIYSKNFIYIYVFFLPRTHRSDPLRHFYA